jgi:glycerol-3-phosphate dehydrogenase
MPRRTRTSYGSAWRAVWDIALAEKLTQRLAPNAPYILAQVIHAVRSEFALTPADVLLRRTRLAFETRDHGAAAAPRVADLMARELGWPAAWRNTVLDAFSAETGRFFS